MGVIGSWESKEPRKLLGCVVNFACHATTSPGGISANYIYYLEKVIQGYYGKDAVVVLDENVSALAQKSYVDFVDPRVLEFDLEGVTRIDRQMQPFEHQKRRFVDGVGGAMAEYELRRDEATDGVAKPVARRDEGRQPFL